MSESLDLSDLPARETPLAGAPVHARRVLVAFLAFGALVLVALAVIVSLLLLAGALHRAF
jgi:hypothetical protein